MKKVLYPAVKPYVTNFGKNHSCALEPFDINILRQKTADAIRIIDSMPCQENDSYIAR
ncbi:MAG: hypothetical protein IPF44_06990 [Betaproteobacteria bacterium]|nr:hypothetical protein [Betaproteobacteria bacterium]